MTEPDRTSRRAMMALADVPSLNRPPDDVVSSNGLSRPLSTSERAEIDDVADLIVCNGYVVEESLVICDWLNVFEWFPAKTTINNVLLWFPAKPINQCIFIIKFSNSTLLKNYILTTFNIFCKIKFN